MFKNILIVITFASQLLAAAPDYFLQSGSNILIFPSSQREELSLKSAEMLFIDETLHKSKLAANLDCQITSKVNSDVRKFSDGFKRIETLEINFLSRYFNAPEEKIFFPVGSKLTREVKNSKLAGVIEELQLEASDNPNSRLVIQHDGKGKITWLSYEDDMKTTPCHINP